MTCENYGSAMAGPGVALECPDGTHGRWHAINNVTVIDSDTKHEHSREYKLQMDWALRGRGREKRRGTSDIEGLIKETGNSEQREGSLYPNTRNGKRGDAPRLISSAVCDPVIPSPP
eukprot:scaffold6866_cov118-Isochrysis_galbana.AAC.8